MTSFIVCIAIITIACYVLVRLPKGKAAPPKTLLPDPPALVLVKVYKEGTPLSKIIADGWSRGFDPKQTLREATAMGYTTSLVYILEEWVKMDAEYDRSEMIAKATYGTGMCPVCGGVELEVEGNHVVCAAPGICWWSKEVN